MCIKDEFGYEAEPGSITFASSGKHSKFNEHLINNLFEEVILMPLTFCFLNARPPFRLNEREYADRSSCHPVEKRPEKHESFYTKVARVKELWRKFTLMSSKHET